MSGSIPQRIARYEIRREIGRGGFGSVYEAYDPTVGRRVALKVLAPTGTDPEVLARFRNEANSAGNLHHKNIVTIYEFGQENGVPFIAMEYLEGEDLQQIIETGRQLSLLEKARIMTEVAEGLGYAHAHGVIHRDVKPGNIRIEPDGGVKIMDFGIARLVRQDSSRLTQAGYVIGTVSYIAPETLAGEDSGALGDIFAYGAVYYELLSGKNPFAAPDIRAMMYKIMQAEPEPLTAIVPGCPEGLEKLIGRALAKDPKLRYQSMEDLLFDSEPILLNLRRQVGVEAIMAAQSAFYSGDFDAAMSAIRQGIQFDPTNKKARELYRTIQEKVQKQSSREKVQALIAESAALEAHGDFTAAREMRESAGKLDPSDPSIQQLLREVEERKQSLEAKARAPAPARSEPAAAEPPQQPSPSGTDDGATRLFSTRPEAAPAPEPAPAAAPASSEGTTLFALPRPGSEPEGSREGSSSGQEQAPSDIVLTVSECADPASLGSKIALQQFPFTIGRRGDWNLPSDPAISARHAEIDYQQGGFFIRDLGSSNGTFVNGRRLPALRQEVLLFGARILLGSNTELVFGAGKLEEIPDLQGQLVGNRFKLLEKLHSSTKSVLYLARDENLERQVVVKLLSPSLAHHSGYREQFAREAHTASLLRHAHICQVLDYGELRLGDPAPGIRSAYVCMEYLPGGSLQRRLNQTEAIPLERIVRWHETVAQALAYVHGRGVIHGGIKPTAVVFDAEENAYLTDFAFATRQGEGDRNVVLGAPAFLAPEQWEGADPVPATDQYSLAVLFYWLLAGIPPFEGQEHFAVRKRNLQRGPEPVHIVAAQNGRPPVPAAVSPVFQKALAVGAGERFAGTVEFSAAFRSALTTPASTRSGPPSVFISYQRAASSAWALLLKREMEREQGFQVFVDAEQQDSTGNFPLKLQRRIEQCDVFICLLADSTLASDWVRQEIRLAWETGKPMIPVFQESYRDPTDLRAAEPFIQELLTYEGVKLLDRQNIYFDAAIQALIVSARRSIETAAARGPVSRRTDESSERGFSAGPSPPASKSFGQWLKALLRSWLG